MRQDKLDGKKALFIYKDGSRVIQCFATILGEDSLFFKVKTEKNLLLIPKEQVLKVKVRNDVSTN